MRQSNLRERRHRKIHNSIKSGCCIRRCGFEGNEDRVRSKADCTRNLRGDTDIDTVLEVMREKGIRRLEVSDLVDSKSITMEKVVHEGYNGVLCVECGGPEPGVGCAGRGVIIASLLFLSVTVSRVALIAWNTESTIFRSAFTFSSFISFGIFIHPHKRQYPAIHSLLFIVKKRSLLSISQLPARQGLLNPCFLSETR
mgnify:CR=1 FL=1